MDIADNSKPAQCESIVQNNWQRRISILTKFVGVQSLVQILAMFSGFLLVRRLTPTQYAFFTLAGTMQGTIAILSDSGVGSALSAIGGRVWNDDKRFGQLIRAGLDFRKYLLIFYSLIVTPILAWMLWENGLNWKSVFLLCLFVLVSVYFQISSGVFQVVLRMRSRFNDIQQVDAVYNGSRLLMLVAVSSFFINAEIGIVINTLCLVLQFWLLRSKVERDIPLEVDALAEDVAGIKRSVRQLTPTSLFYCVQGQLTVTILSIFGNTRSIADVGALGRLAVVFAIFSSVMANIIFPRFARCQNPTILRRMYWQNVGLGVGFGTLLILITLLFPRYLLWILGKQYDHLGGELVYVMLNAVVGMLGSVISGMNNERSWTKGVWIAIPLILVSQICLIPWLNLSSLKDVVILNALPFALSFIPFLIRAQIEMRRFKFALDSV